MGIIGGIFWLTNIYSQGNANASSINEIQTDNKSFKERIYLKLSEIAERQAKMDQKLDDMKHER